MKIFCVSFFISAVLSDLVFGEALSTYSAAELKCLERTLACEARSKIPAYKNEDMRAHAAIECIDLAMDCLALEYIGKL
ncbi:Oidioi.mRNA.OKI2018_I69.chr1.g548.t1.cds [Oikopleura dioica]|uniref:Oidioi.mRNA.OKI2018_I69.chr1.g548.t1.cds n=1 Tax=Oikopleura dioica TaxID=34765 RepID=A0ABN7SK71_OIKDI|nr:Oidioi.mRNA.OKI2018_I69.chr1.g548.t1.cds [Oikopleura dioica]